MRPLSNPWPPGAADAEDASLGVAQNGSETLVAFAGATAELPPGLATSWTASKDATVWTLELREDVAFRDGTPFDAEAVRFDLERWNDPDHPFAFRDRGKAYVP